MSKNFCRVLSNGTAQGRESSRWKDERIAELEKQRGNSAELTEDILRAKNKRIAKLEARERKLVDVIKSTKELAEFWISQGKPFNASEEDYRIWLALGHHSDSMTKCKNFLGKIDAQQQEKGDG